MNKLFKMKMFRKKNYKKIFQISLMKFIILITLTSLSMSESAWGTCTVTYKEGKKFQLNDYLGKWYEVARHNSIPFQKGECNTAQYSLNENKNISVFNKEKVGSNYNTINAEGFATDDPFRFKIDFGQGFWNKYFKGDYRIVDTDYKNFAIVYSCTDYFFGKFYYCWILSRTPELDQKIFDNAILELQERFDINKDELHLTDQSKEKCGDN